MIKKNTPIRFENFNINDLDFEERRVVTKIMESKGKIYQSILVKNSGYSKVKVSRIIKELEKKEIVKKEKFGMTNIITLIKKIR